MRNFWNLRYFWKFFQYAYAIIEKVNEFTARLKNDGYKILSGPRTTGDGYYESCVLGPENNILELVAWNY